MARPNFLIFMTDHQRGDTILPNSRVITPNIDRFRQRAVTFTQAYCPAPHCCPSRATFFTGLYPSQHGVWNNVGVSNTLSRGLFDGVRTFSEDLRDAGYDLYFSGKWHVSQTESPADRGFELLHHNTRQYRAFPHRPEYSDWDVYNTEPIDTEGMSRREAEILRPGYTHYVQYGIDEDPFGDTEVAEAAEARIRALKDTKKPFLLYAGPLGPHDPYKVPQRFLDLYDPDTIELPESFNDPMLDLSLIHI